MKYAIAHGYRYDNPASDLVYALKNKKVKNLASLSENEMPEFLRRIKKYPADTKTHYANCFGAKRDHISRWGKQSSPSFTRRLSYEDENLFL